MRRVLLLAVAMEACSSTAAWPGDLDSYGGHTGATPDSASAYHYHLNEQTSANTGTIGQKQWFITKGAYRGAPGTCTGCQ